MLAKKTRFHNTKARRLVEVRRKFYPNRGEKDVLKKALVRFDDPIEMRDWLVVNINGYGYKEASHFLRNIGKGEELAILDRHILKNLILLGVINEMPKNLSRMNYIHIEGKMARFSKASNIPMSHLDLLLWHKEAGEIFK